MRIIEQDVPAGGIASKYLQATLDGFAVETTYINRPEKHILCVSTQVGCPIGCRFCVSGLRAQEGQFQRSLTSEELVSQCRNVAELIDYSSGKPLLFSFMGEGEPFLNFDACLRAFDALAGASWPVEIRLAVSTSGIRPDLIRVLGKRAFPVSMKLQVSLHGPTDKIRRRIVPITRSLQEILAAVCEDWGQSRRPMDWNYVLCAGVNDAPEHAKQLLALLGGGWHVKFTALNHNASSPFRPTPAARVTEFRSILEAGGITTECYVTDESGIGSGCGQLSYHYAQGHTPPH